VKKEVVIELSKDRADYKSARRIEILPHYKAKKARQKAQF